MTDRYEVEPEYQIEPGCKCCSCWEYTGKWLVCDAQDEMEDLVFDTEEQAKEKAKQMNELNEKNFKDMAEQIRNDPSPETQQKANDLRKQFNQFLGSQNPQLQEDLMKIVKEKTDGQSGI